MRATDGSKRSGRPLDGRPWQRSQNFALSRRADLSRIIDPPADLQPYLASARQWRDETLTAVGIQYNALGPIPCQLIHIASLSWAMAHRAITRDKPNEAKLHLAEVRNCLLACWSIASREGGGVRGHDPTEPLRQALAQWTDLDAFPGVVKEITSDDLTARASPELELPAELMAPTPVPVVGEGGAFGLGPQKKTDKRKGPRSPELRERLKQSALRRHARRRAMQAMQTELVKDQ